MSDNTEARTVADLAAAGTAPHELDPAKVYSLVVPDGGEQETLDLGYLLPAPRRTSGLAKFDDAESFTEYYKVHAPADLVFLYASEEKRSVAAVFNDDQAGAPGWRDHRAVLELKHTPEWLHWTSASGRLINQVDFAEHIEAGLAEIVKPTAADMLELAQSFEATSKNEFKSSHRLSSGQRELVYAEKVEAGAGANRKIPIPDTFDLGIAPWIGADRFKVTARLRYRIEGSRLLLGYTLVRPHEVLTDAFSQVLERLGESTGATVLRGAPAPARA